MSPIMFKRNHFSRIHYILNYDLSKVRQPDLYVYELLELRSWKMLSSYLSFLYLQVLRHPLGHHPIYDTVCGRYKAFHP